MDTKQQPEALLMERAMGEHPAFGTAPIRCGKTRCSWRGYETELKQTPGTMGGMRCTTSTCPTCGNDAYMFMTPGEVKAWERKKAKETQ